MRFILGSLATSSISEVDYNGNLVQVAQLYNVSGMGSFGVRVFQNSLFVCANHYALSPNNQNIPQSILYKYKIDGATYPYPILGYYDLTNVGTTSYRLINDVAIDTSGNAYVTDSFYGVIYKVDTTGNASVWSSNTLYQSAPNVIGINGIVFITGDFLIVGRQDTSQILKVPINPDGSAGSPVVVTYQDSTTIILSPNGLRLLSNSRIIVMNASGAAILNTNDNWMTISSVSSRWNSLINTPSGITDSNGIFSILQSDINQFLSSTGVSVSNYSIIQLSGSAIPGLYPDNSHDWVVAIVVLLFIALIVGAIGIYFLFFKKKNKQYENNY